MPLVSTLTFNVVLSTVAAAPAERLYPQDFAFGAEIQTTTGEALQTVLVPHTVYAQVHRADLGDLRVFNDVAEVVPHTVRTQSEPATTEALTTDLPFFPVRGPQGGLEALNLHVERSRDGTVVNVRGGPPRAGDQLLAYVVDASALEHGIRSLRLEWRPRSKGFVIHLNVEGSDDLTSWRVLTHHATLAALDFAGHTLERRVIELPVTQTKFLRLVGSEESLPFALTRISAELVGPTAEPERYEIQLTALSEPSPPGEYRFDAGGPVPIDRASVDLPERNTVVEVELSSAVTADGPWQPRFGGLIYRIVVDGTEIVSPEIHVSPSRNRFWRLRVDGKGGGLGAGTPSMRARWIPEQILFIARGKAPWILAYGSHKALPSVFDAAALTKLSANRDDATTHPSAFLGVPYVLGGEAALTPPPPPLPWKTWTLWGAILLGVVLLGWMAMRLLRQLAGTPASKV